MPNVLPQSVASKCLPCAINAQPHRRRRFKQLPVFCGLPRNDRRSFGGRGMNTAPTNRIAWSGALLPRLHSNLENLTLTD